MSCDSPLGAMARRPRVTDLIFLCILLVSRTSFAQDPYVSSGTCYYGPNLVADSSFIPCGNTAFGNFPCCEVGSVCLDNNACYLEAAGTTYVAGCTDSSYSDQQVCPYKGEYSSQQWAGLVYCNATSDEWTLCDDSGVGNLVVPVPGCYCPDDAPSDLVAFIAPSVIPNEVLLPAASGGSLSVFPGYFVNTVPTSTTPTTTSTHTTPTSTSSHSSTPTSTSSSTPTSTSSSTTLTSSTTSTSTSSSTSSSDGGAAAASQTSASPTASATTTPASGLSTGAKAGIGIGAALGGVALAALIAFLAVCMRRRKQRREEASLRPQSEVADMGRAQYGSAQNIHSWAGHQSQLSSDERTSASMVTPSSVQQSWSRPLSEVEGSIPTYQSMGDLRGNGYNDGSYQPYRRAEMPPVGVQGMPASNTGSQGSYRPGRQMGDGLYEMPAHLPGSTLL